VERDLEVPVIHPVPARCWEIQRRLPIISGYRLRTTAAEMLAGVGARMLSASLPALGCRARGRNGLHAEQRASRRADFYKGKQLTMLIATPCRAAVSYRRITRACPRYEQHIAGQFSVIGCRKIAQAPAGSAGNTQSCRRRPPADRGISWSAACPCRNPARLEPLAAPGMQAFSRPTARQPRCGSEADQHARAYPGSTSASSRP